VQKTELFPIITETNSLNYSISHREMFKILHSWTAGTCSNNLDDDFERKDGTLIDSVPDFGASWRVSGTDEECECYPRGNRHCANCSMWEY